MELEKERTWSLADLVRYGSIWTYPRHVDTCRQAVPLRDVTGKRPVRSELLMSSVLTSIVYTVLSSGSQCSSSTGARSSVLCGEMGLANGTLDTGGRGILGFVELIPCRCRSRCPNAVAVLLGGLARIIFAVMRGKVRR